jgi:lipopolysaccharide export system permease protein
MDHQEKRAKRVFVQTEEGGRTQVACAAEAYQTVDDQTGQQILVFADGHAYEFGRGGGRDQSMRFKEFSLPIERKEISPRYRLKAAPTVQLTRSSDPEEIAEAQWRLSTPVSTVLLGFLGLVLSRTSPRRGKYSRVFLAIVVYAIYYNVSLLARHWVEQGVVGTIPGVWWVHSLVFGFILFSLWDQGLAFRQVKS